MITYPVDVNNTKWAVLQVSTGELVARNKTWPVADGGEIQGQDPDFLYLLQLTTAQPDYDSRLYKLVATEVVDAPANELRTTWSTEKRSIEERKAIAKNIEAQKLTETIDYAREPTETRILLCALLRDVLKAEEFPPATRALADAYMANGTAILQNRDRATQILADIDAGVDPDLDIGWA